MSLTNEQSEFVDEMDNNVALIAIPGSGKTTAVTEKIIAILATGKSAVAMTFTSEAANELKARAVSRVAPEAADRLKVGTFHGLTRRALMTLPNSPIRGLTLIEEADALLFKRMALENAGIDDTREAVARLDGARSKVTDPYGIAEASQLHPKDPARPMRIKLAEDLRLAVHLYEEALRRNRRYDFAGLLRMALEVVRSGQPVFVADYVLVDEVQDVDEVQLHLIIEHQHWSIVFVVGDDDQSIYRFRQGLGYRAFQDFIRLTGAQRMSLSVNFRCKAEILAWAGEVIEMNTARMPKQLIPAKSGGAELRLIQCRNETSEDALVATLARWALQKGAELVAVIARTNQALMEVQAALTGEVDFERIRCDSFWDIEPCAVALSLLRYLLDPEREMAAVEEASYWVGAHPADLDRLRDAADGMPIDGVFDDFRSSGELREDSLVAITLVRDLLHETGYPRAPVGEPDADQAIHGVFCALLTAVEAGCVVSKFPSDVLTKLLSSAQRALMKMKGTLAQRLAVIARVQENPGDAPVKLLTMHRSKGREFDSVFIIRANDEVKPGDAPTDADNEEERRLLYVAMTRARASLTVTFPGEEVRFGRTHSLALTRLLNVPLTPRQEYGDEYHWVHKLMSRRN